MGNGICSQAPIDRRRRHKSAWCACVVQLHAQRILVQQGNSLAASKCMVLLLHYLCSRLVLLCQEESFSGGSSLSLTYLSLAGQSPNRILCVGINSNTEPCTLSVRLESTPRHPPAPRHLQTGPGLLPASGIDFGRASSWPCFSRAVDWSAYANAPFAF